MGACLEYLSLYLTFCARTSHPVDLPLLLSSALLPAIEENLAVGIEDMEGGASLFSTTLELVHAAALLPAADARALLGGIPGGYTPPQRKAVRQLCDEADALVAQYLASLSGHACSAREEDPPEEEEASRFQAVQHVASAVRANFPPVDPAPQPSSPGVAGGKAGGGEARDDAAAWRRMPSVATWAGGREHSERAVEALLDSRYQHLPPSLCSFCARYVPHHIMHRTCASLLLHPRDVCHGFPQGCMVGQLQKGGLVSRRVWQCPR